MDLLLLRRRFVIAMGLPALGTTWAACAAPGPGNPGGPNGGTVLHIAGDDGPSGDGAGAGQSGQGGAQVAVAVHGLPCGTDEVHEVVCGSVAPPSVKGECGSHGESLTAYGQSSISVTKYTASAHDPAFKGWPLSEPATERYRATLDGIAAQAKHNYCCYESCTHLRAGDRGQERVPPGFVHATKCVPAPRSTNHPAVDGGTCPAAIELEGQMRALVRPDGAQCCYLLPRPAPTMERPRPNRGRPLRVGGTPVLAGAEERGEWQSAGAGSRPASARPAPPQLASSQLASSQLASSRLASSPLAPSVRGLSGEERAALAAAWREEARMEHASIAAFAKLSLELLALGAPPELVRDAHRAAMEEVDHAHVAFTFASVYGGVPVGPAPLEQATSLLSERATLARLVEETLLDGCVGETAAAVEAARAAEGASDPSIAEALRAIAADETSHAELGFRVVAWAVRQAREEVSPVVARVLAELRAAVEVEVEGEPAAPAERGALAAHGVLGEGERARVRHDVIRDVVIPALAALVQPYSMEPTAPVVVCA